MIILIKQFLLLWCFYLIKIDSQGLYLDDEEAVIFVNLEGVGCGEGELGLEPPKARLGCRLVLGLAERAAAPRR